MIFYNKVNEKFEREKYDRKNCYFHVKWGEMDKIWLSCMIRVTDFDELADLNSLFDIQAIGTYSTLTLSNHKSIMVEKHILQRWRLLLQICLNL